MIYVLVPPFITNYSLGLPSAPHPPTECLFLHGISLFAWDFSCIKLPREKPSNTKQNQLKIIFVVIFVRIFSCVFDFGHVLHQLL